MSTLYPIAKIADLTDSATETLRQLRRGIEREALRSDLEGFIAQTPHPVKLGHALMHSEITTDYSEALLELITPVCNSTKELFSELRRIHQYVLSNLDDELLWPGSMPTQISGEQSIPIARYGESNIGKLKYIYRKGLEVRYGRTMQSIAGIHYNFSLADDFWPHWQTIKGKQNESLQAFKSNSYFGLIRNFRRHSWLIMYLFGASPALDNSFVENQSHKLQPLGDNSQYLPYSTSLRMSDLGYHNSAQSALNICFNHLSSFTETLQRAIKEPYPPYEAMGIKKNGEYIQLNTNILQIENEYYSTIRPKRVTRSGEKPIEALRGRGVEYIEVRCLDVNPFVPMGICESQVAFLDVFLLYCLLSESADICDDECKIIEENFAAVVSFGRQPGLELTLDVSDKKVPLKEAGLALLDALLPIAKLMNGSADIDYVKALEIQKAKLHDVMLTPSAKVIKALEVQGGYVNLMQSLAKQHRHENSTQVQSNEEVASMEKSAEQSFIDEQKNLAKDSSSFLEFLQAYMT